MKFRPVLVRPRAWWNNKIPLSIFLFLVLVNGETLSRAVLPFFGLIIVVCSVGNFGYALNDLYDQDEDRRAGNGVCQTCCPLISCGVSDFRGADFGFGVKPDGSDWLPVAGFA
jgi:hypothetical protein